MKLILLILLWVPNLWAVEPDDHGNRLESVRAIFQEFDLQKKALLESYVEFESQFGELMKLQSELQPLEKKYSDQMFSKKRDEAEYAILEAKVKSGRVKRDEILSAMMGKYPFPVTAILNSYEKTKSKPKMSKEFIESAVRGSRNSGMGFRFPAEECFSSKDGFNLEKACVKSGLENCQSLFSTDNGVLVAVHLDDTLEVKKTIFKSENDFVKYYEERYPDNEAQQKFKELTTKISRARYSACKLIADRQISFSTKKIDFLGTVPKWMDKFSYSDPMGYHELVDEKCLSKSGVPKDLVDKIQRLKMSYDLSYPLNGLEKGLENCRKNVSQICENTYELKGKTVLTYPTQNCSLREVTAEDIEADLERWRSAGMEDADITSHSQLLDRIKICNVANEYGYSWRYVKPAMGPSCKNGKNK